jgi:ArsR family transcriptional regulator
VTDLAHELRLNQPSVSRHLKVLRDHDLVRTTRCGVSIVYELADSRLIEALNILRTVLRDQISHKAHMVLERKE